MSKLIILLTLDKGKNKRQDVFKDMDQAASQKIPTPPSSSAFSPLETLFKESWRLFTSRWLRLFLFMVIVFAIYVAVFAILLIVGGIFFVATNKSHVFGSSAMAPEIAFLIVSFFVVFFVITAIASTAYSAWNIFTLNEPLTTSFSEIFRKGFSYIWPLLVLGFLTFFIFIGGFFFFIIPVFFFLIFFGFANYEMLCANKKPLDSLKRSYTMVVNNFWEVFLRFVLLYVISIILNILLSSVNGRPPNPGMSFITSIIGFLFGWYSMCYVYVLYKETRQRTNFDRPVSMQWVWIISTLGFIMFILVTIFSITFISQAVSSGQFQKFMNQWVKNKQSTTNMHQFNNGNMQNTPSGMPQQYHYTYPTNTSKAI